MGASFDTSPLGTMPRGRRTGRCASHGRTSSSRLPAVDSTAIALVESARLGFIAATIAEQLDGIEGHLAERERQSEWLVEHLALA